MAGKFSPHFVELVYDALLKSFWRKQALRRFLRRCHISESYLAQLTEQETKRDWLDRIFPKIEATERGQALIQEMAKALVDQDSFPDLENWEDSAQKIKAAQEALAALRAYLKKQTEEHENEKEIEAKKKQHSDAQAKVQRSQADLQQLRSRLDALCGQIGTQGGGYAFQDWFYDLLDFSEINNRRPYNQAGRQIDGSITVDGTTYLVELKFTGNQAAATDIDSILAKVNTKADNTMAVMVSISGYSSVAIDQASFARSPLLLFDFNHLYMALNGIEKFPDVIRRVRRHSSQTGRAYLASNEFGGG